jgi:hypothetical protein
MKPYETESGRMAVQMNIPLALFVDEYQHANKLAKELGYKSLREYVMAKVSDIVYWRLPQDHEDNTRK